VPAKSGGADLANERVQFRETRSALHGTFAGYGHCTTGASIAQRMVNRFSCFAAGCVRGAEAVAGARGVDLADRERRHAQPARPVGRNS
jgi:hypothetical protein